MRNVTCSKIKAAGDIRRGFYSDRNAYLKLKHGVIFQQILLLPAGPTPTWVASNLHTKTVLWSSRLLLPVFNPSNCRSCISYKNHFLVTKYDVLPYLLSSRAEKARTEWGIQLSRLLMF
jgi:hypothetical protein